MRLLFASPSRFFLVFSCLFGIVYLLLTPPIHAPDEGNHFLRIYEITQGGLLRNASPMPASLVAFVVAFSDWQKPAELVQSGGVKAYLEYMRGWAAKPLQAKNRMMLPATRARYYSPLPYLAALPFVGLGAMLGLSPLMLFLLARLSLCITGTAMLYSAIRIAPRFKWQLACIGLLPATLFIRSAVSADTLTIGYASLFFAFILRILERRRPPAGAEIAALSLLACALCLSKTVYAPWVLLFLLLPRACFASRAQQWRIGIPVVLLPLLLGGIWLHLSYAVVPPTVGEVPAGGPTAAQLNFLYASPPKADAAGQQALLRRQPWRAVVAPVMTLIAGTPALVKDMVETVGTSSLRADFLAWPWRWALFLLLFFLPATDRQDAAPLPRSMRLGMLMLFFAGYWLICMSMYLLWTPVGLFFAFGVQGRYVTPLLPLLAAPLSTARAARGALRLAVQLLLLFLLAASLPCFIATDFHAPLFPV